MKKTLITIVITAVIMFAAGYGVAYKFGPSHTSSGTSTVSTSTVPSAPLMSLNGVIKGIKDNVITMDATPPVGPNAEKDFLVTRTVTVTSSTTLFKRVVKDQAEFQKELAAYQKVVGNAATTGTATSSRVTFPSLPTPPVPNTDTAIPASALVAGDWIEVMAASDIATAAQFQAMSIIVVPH